MCECVILSESEAGCVYSPTAVCDAGPRAVHSATSLPCGSVRGLLSGAAAQHPAAHRCVCVCVTERERVRESVCVCVCVSE